MYKLYIGVDIGGTKCAVSIGKVVRGSKESKKVKILEKTAFPTEEKKSPLITINEIIVICRNLVQKYENQGEIRGVGISCGGPLDENKGIILSPPNLPNWDGIHIVNQIVQVLKIPVHIQNDANACAIAEWKFGAGIGTENMIFLTFGTGLGAGLILNGKLYSGSNSMAGEVGHIRLTETGPVGYMKEGSFEGYCSGGGIKDLCRVIAEKEHGKGVASVFLDKKLYLLEELSAKIIFEYAKTGNVFAKEVIELCGKYLGKGISILIDILNPEKIVLGSIFAREEELLKPIMQDWIRKEALTQSASACQVVSAGLGETIGDVAALTVAVYHDECNCIT